MRYGLILLLVILVSGCAHNRLRFVNLGKKTEAQVESVETHKKESPKIIDREATSSHTEAASIQPVETETPYTLEHTSSTVLPNELDSPEETFISEVEAIPTPSPQDSVSLKDPEVIAAALDTENTARRSRGLFLGSLLSFIFSILFFPLLLGSIALFVWALILRIQAKNARFITAKGEEYLHKGLRLMITIIVLWVLVLTALGVAILLLF